MKKNKTFNMIILLLVSSLSFSACQTSSMQTQYTNTEEIVSDSNIKKNEQPEKNINTDKDIIISEKQYSTNNFITQLKPISLITTEEFKNETDIELTSVYMHKNENVEQDLTHRKDLLYSLSFSDNTEFANTPADFNKEETIEWGKNPGLGFDILKKHGFTGSGSIVAYIDQRIVDHEQFDNINLHYKNNVGSPQGDMHGIAVLSLLAGKDFGIIPDAEIYYYAHAAWNKNQLTHALCLYQIIEENEKLPDDKKIKMVGISDFVNIEEENPEEFQQAIKDCEDAGIMVWLCDDYLCGYFSPETDRNNPYNVNIYSKNNDFSQYLVCVPTMTKTTAGIVSGAEYIYWGEAGGQSWAVPYVLGLYADALSIDPTLTKEEIKTLIKETATINNDIRIINPIEFIATVLERVGNNNEANAIRDDYKNSLNYVYAIINKEKTSPEDLKAIENYLKNIKNVTILEVDASSCKSAEDVYTLLLNDYKERGGMIKGVQIFGTPFDVPSFNIQYRALNNNEIITGIEQYDNNNMFNTDLFYGNLENDVNEIGSDYNVYEHFNNKKNITIKPEWPVVRLPLKNGQYKIFFDKYNDFALKTKYKQLPLINFNSPNYGEIEHTDDVCLFLDRLCNEFNIIGKNDYRLYGVQTGQYPVKNQHLLGDFTAENITKENKKDIAEFFIYAFGRPEHISIEWFENDEFNLTQIMTPDTINEIFSSNPYYLDCWACYSGAFSQNKKDNFTTKALSGNCVGMFSMTTLSPKSGLDCHANLDKTEEGNFFYFHYNYFKALNEGCSRSKSFFKAQQAFADTLLEDQKINGVKGKSNYQLNFYTLFAYENFGIFEPNTFVEKEINEKYKIKLISEKDLAYGIYGYTGKQIEPQVEIYCDGKLLKNNIDYSLEYTNNVNIYECSIFDTDFDPNEAPCIIIHDKTNNKEEKEFFKILTTD